jgi:hypothetical protein
VSPPQVSAPPAHPDDQAFEFAWIPAVALRRDAGAVGLVLPARAGAETDDSGLADRVVSHVNVELGAAISAELANLELGVRSFLERLDRVTAPVFGPGNSARLYGWAAVAAAVAVVAGEISRRQLRPAGMDPADEGRRVGDPADGSRKG